jgi:hypothetical protein
MESAAKLKDRLIDVDGRTVHDKYKCSLGIVVGNNGPQQLKPL